MTTFELLETHRRYHRTWWALMLNGLLALAVGTFVLLSPLESVAALALVIALWALFAGLVDIVRAFELRPALDHWWLILISGLVDVGFGVLALIFYPILSLTFAVVFVSWWLLVAGVLELYGAYRLRRSGLHWGSSLAIGVFAAGAGLFALIVPPATLIAILGLLAALGILSGIVLIIGSFKLLSGATRSLTPSTP